MTWRKLVSVLLVVFVLATMIVASVAPVLAQENGEEPPKEPPEEPPLKEEPFVEEEILSRVVIRNLQITPVHAQPRQAVAIRADVINEGNRWESATLNLLINRQFEQSVQVGVAPLTAQPINFAVYREHSGQYSVTIGDTTGWFNVLSEPQRLYGQPIAGDGLGTSGIITVVVIGILFIAGMIVAFRST